MASAAGAQSPAPGTRVESAPAVQARCSADSRCAREPGSRGQLAARTPAKWTRYGTTLAGALVFLVGALTLSEYLGGWSIGIDQWLFHEAANTVATSEPSK